MIRWINRARPRRARSKGPVTATRFARPWLESLEDRLAPATSLAPPTILDPAAAVRVDQASYSILGSLQEAAKNKTTILAYNDSNHNGVFDAGVDALVGSAGVVKGSTAFSVSVNLQQNADNQFFLVANDGKLFSSAVKVP